MVFVSNISSVVKEANSVAGFGLDPQFAETLSELLSRCRAAGLDFRISQGLRTPQKQAEYYCKWVRLALPKIPNPVTDAVVSVATFKVVKPTRALKKPRRTKAHTKWAVRTRSGAGRSKKRTARSKSPARPKRGRRRAA